MLGAQPSLTGSKFHGGGEYSKTVFKALTERIGENKLIAFYNRSLYLDDWLIKLIKEKNITVYDVNDYNEIKNIFQKETIDVYFSGIPYAKTNGIIPSYVRKIGTFHGLRSLELPTDGFEFRYRKGIGIIKSIGKQHFIKKLKNRAWEDYKSSMAEYDEIICVSNHTKYSILNYYYHQNKKPTVFYTPAKYVEDIDRDEKPMVEGKYILLLGMNRWEKNGCRALKALEEIFEKKMLNEYRVVTVGQIPKLVETLMKHKEKYLKFGYIEPRELENLYYHCDFFLYPSLNEGFGMPPLEAMRYGKTCIVSGICSLPEVCGDAVYYCNPYDIDEIQNRILMASEKKIEKSTVVEHYQKIVTKQTKDLYGLCQYILEGKDGKEE